VTPPDPPRHVVIIGLMGSGKTTVGRRVAAALGRPLIDSDAAIEAREGRTGREIREADGTEALHRLERRHLREALESTTPSVVCAAASTLEDPASRERLRDPSILVAWLTATPETAAERFDDQKHRPSYGADPRAFLAEQAERRGPWFREVADLELPTDDANPEELAARIVDEALGGR
jgi:shikimate kinase